MNRLPLQDALHSRLGPQRSPLLLTWTAAAWIGSVGNWPLWLHMSQMPDFSGLKGTVFVVTFACIATALIGSLLSMLAWDWILKPMLTAMLLATAALSHFIGSYGVVIDNSMLISALETDPREVRDLLNPRLLVDIVVLGVLPSLWIWRQRVRRTRWPHRIAANLLGGVAALAVGFALAWWQSAELASTLRNHRKLTKMVSPVNAIWSAGALAAKQFRTQGGPPTIVGVDAKLASRAEGSKPPLIVLVVGETARSANFSLNGYERATNPKLSRRAVVSYRNVASCGTSTAASLPCMFSHLGRDGYDSDSNQESLLDVLQRAGLAVLWVDNQSGCKGACLRVPTAEASKPARPEHPLPTGICGADGECADEAMLHDLDARIAQLDPQRTARGIVLVLHQMGSHGPAYFRRVRPAWERFTPVCKNSSLRQCSLEEIRNAYDNTILYTDHFLDQTIAWLERQVTRYDPGLVYISDHGESLGEGGLYLHGLPYAIAPTEQKVVPLVLWLPEPTLLSRGLNPECLFKSRDETLSHDGLFHSILNLAGVQTAVYRSDWDWLKRCKT